MQSIYARHIAHVQTACQDGFKAFLANGYYCPIYINQLTDSTRNVVKIMVEFSSAIAQGRQDCHCLALALPCLILEGCTIWLSVTHGDELPLSSALSIRNLSRLLERKC